MHVRPACRLGGTIAPMHLPTSACQGRRRTRAAAAAFALLAGCLVIAAPAVAADQPQWGRAWSRNMTSDEKGLPDSFDPATKRNVKWVAELGSESYATPIVAGGRVLI